MNKFFKALAAIFALAAVAGCAGQYESLVKDQNDSINTANQAVLDWKASEMAANEARARAEQETFRTVAVACGTITADMPPDTARLVSECIEEVSESYTYTRAFEAAGGGRSSGQPRLMKPHPIQRPPSFGENLVNIVRAGAPFVSPIIDAVNRPDIARVQAERDIALYDAWGSAISSTAGVATAVSDNYVEIDAGRPPSTQFGDGATILGDGSYYTDNGSQVGDNDASRTADRGSFFGDGNRYQSPGPFTDSGNDNSDNSDNSVDEPPLDPPPVGPGPADCIEFGPLAPGCDSGS